MSFISYVLHGSLGGDVSNACCGDVFNTSNAVRAFAGGLFECADVADQVAGGDDVAA